MGMTSMAQVSPEMKTKCIRYSMTGIKGPTLFLSSLNDCIVFNSEAKPYFWNWN